MDDFSKGMRKSSLLLLSLCILLLAGCGNTPAPAKNLITQFSLPNPNSAHVAITSGPDGAVWFTEEISGRITPQGKITQFPAPSNSSPYGITSGPDGALWFTEAEAGKIGRITPQGKITQFAIPDVIVDSSPSAIASGPDGALWFTEGLSFGADNSTSNRIGRLVPPT